MNEGNLWEIGFQGSKLLPCLPTYRIKWDQSKDLAATRNLDQSKHDDETNDDDEVYPCDSCDNIFDEIEDLIEHYGETAHNN